MTGLMHHLRAVHLKALGVALLATVFSAGLAFADGLGPAPAAQDGLDNAALHAGKTVPVRSDEVTTDDTDEDEEEEEGDEELEDSEELEEDGDNCATDPTTLTPEELAEMRHGSIVCWAAHQETWPEEFENHGKWVSSWAKWKAPDEETADDEDTDEESLTTQGRGNGKGKGKGHSK